MPETLESPRHGTEGDRAFALVDCNNFYISC